MQREDPLITFVIPAYNRAATIGAALESVQAQTYPHWEAIVVDDGSKDRTADVVAGMARQDSRIRLLRQDRNLGAQAARNAGIRAARGEWICFLDSDDQYLPDSIERRLRIARETNVLVVHSECYVSENGVKSEASVSTWTGIPAMTMSWGGRVLGGDERSLRFRLHAGGRPRPMRHQRFL